VNELSKRLFVDRFFCTSSLLLNPFSPLVNLISGYHEFIFSGFPDNPISGNKEFMIT